MFLAVGLLLLARAHADCANLGAAALMRGSTATSAAARVDVASSLAALSAPELAERDRAGRWLAAHLEPADEPTVRAVLALPNADVRARLVEVLSGEDRLFGLCVALASSADEPARTLGLRALEESILRADPGAWLRGASWVELDVELLDSGGAARELERGTEVVLGESLRGATIEDIVDLLARALPSAPRIVVDPALRGHKVTRLPRDPAAFARVVPLLGASVDAVFEGFGYDPQAFSSLRWLHAFPRGADQPSSGALVRDWIVAVASAPDAAQRSASAITLARLHWPALQLWFEQRWLATDDPVWLDGVCSAADGGVPGTAFADRVHLPRILAALHVACERGDEPRALRIARALGVGSAPPFPELVLGLAALAPREAYARLVALELRGSRSPELSLELAKLLARADLPAAIGFQALRVERAAGSLAAGIDVPSIEAIFRWALDHDRSDEFRALARRRACWPPAAWGDPASTGLPRMPHALAAIVDGWFFREPISIVARHLVALASDERVGKEGGNAEGFSAEAERQELGRLARSWSIGSDVERVRRAFAAARELAKSETDAARVRSVHERLDVLEVLAGAPAPDVRERVRTRFLAAPPSTRAEFEACGALASGVGGDEIRARLVELAGEARASSDLVHAIRSAVEALDTAREPTAAIQFRQDVELGASVRLRDRIARERWRVAPPVRLSDFDRSWTRSGL